MAISRQAIPSAFRHYGVAETNKDISLIKRVEEFEKQLLIDMYKQFGSQFKVAKALKTSKSTISKKFKKYKIKQ